MQTKPRVRVKMGRIVLGRDVPDDARDSDLVVGNRGATAEVYSHRGQYGSNYLLLRYVGNIMDWGSAPNRWATDPTRRVYDFR